MTPITLQRELKKIAEKHEQIGKDLERVLILAAQDRDIPYGDWELKPAAIKQIEKARRNIAAGKGIRIRTHGELRRFFDAL